MSLISTCIIPHPELEKQVKPSISSQLRKMVLMILPSYTGCPNSEFGCASYVIQQVMM